MPARRRPRRSSRPQSDRGGSVFLNVPYDDSNTDLFLAYISGLCALGLKPRASLEVVSSRRRLERIFQLMNDCDYSIHDLSRVQLGQESGLPRFNMPFELGLAVATDMIQGRDDEPRWHVFDTAVQSLQTTLSDLGGTDIHVHSGKPEGIFRELLNIFERELLSDLRFDPNAKTMLLTYRVLQHELPGILSKVGATTPFAASVFGHLVRIAGDASFGIMLQRHLASGPID